MRYLGAEEGGLMKLHVALLACAGLFVLASAASAEPPIGSRIGESTVKQKVNDPAVSAHIAHELAGCALLTRGSAARDLLNARTAEAAKEFLKRLDGDEDCLANIDRNDRVEGVEVTFPPDVMRGDLAEELVKRDRSAAAQLPPLPLQKVYSRPWYAFTGRDVSVDEMATCVADTNPSAILALLDSAPYSPGEGTAFANLVPYMGPCLRSGTKLAGAREPLRAALAEALYQRLENPSEEVAPVTPNSAGAAPK